MACLRTPIRTSLYHTSNTLRNDGILRVKTRHNHRRRRTALEQLIVIIIAVVAVVLVFKILSGIIRFIVSLAIIGLVIYILLQLLNA